MTYRRRKVSLLVAVFAAQDEWRRMTKPQRAALLDPNSAHPRVRARLYEMHLLRKDGKRSVWGDRVLHFTRLMREGSR